MNSGKDFVSFSFHKTIRVYARTQKKYYLCRVVVFNDGFRDDKNRKKYFSIVF